MTEAGSPGTVASAVAVAAAVGRAMRALGVNDGCRLLVAVSGGPDSATLLHLLRSLAVDHDWQLTVAHVDHGIASTDTRARERQAVDALVQRRPSTLQRLVVPVGELVRHATATGRSLEDLARERRYQLLRQAADTVGADHIALGHHADDNLETVFMRLLSGSPGPHTIPALRGRVVRPLLGLRRADLREYLRYHQVPYVVDPSNKDPSHLRNRVRAQLPALLASIPGAATGLVAASEWGDLLWADAVRRARAQLPWALLIAGRGGERASPAMRIARHVFNGAAPAVRLAALYRAVDGVIHGSVRHSDTRCRIPRRFLMPLLSPESSTVTGHGVRISHSTRWVTVERAEPARFVVPGQKSGYLLTVGDPPIEGCSIDYRIRGAGLIARFRKPERASQVDSQPQSGMDGGPRVAWLRDADFPVVVRSPRPGDAITLAERRVPLKRLLGRWGVAPHERWQMPVVANAGGVRAVAGSVLGYRDVGATAGGNIIVEFVDNGQRSPDEIEGRSAARTGFEEGP